MTTPTEIKPLPCPFCGGLASVFKREVHETTPEPRRTLFWYVCNTHECGVALTHGEWSEAQALKKWNHRTP
jgi:Lar family restriction alleviation protein